MRGENIAAREVAQRCLALAQEHAQPGMSALGHRFMGQILWMMGAFTDSRVHLERTLELCAANRETITSYRRFCADDEGKAMAGLFPTLLLLGLSPPTAAPGGGGPARARSPGI